MEKHMKNCFKDACDIPRPYVYVYTDKNIQ
jgi:hypothetical protein